MARKIISNLTEHGPHTIDDARLVVVTDNISTGSAISDGSQAVLFDNLQPLNSGNSLPCELVVLQADKTNSVDVFVGNSSNASIRLSPGELITVYIDNINKLYVTRLDYPVVSLGPTGLTTVNFYIPIVVANPAVTLTNLRVYDILNEVDWSLQANLQVGDTLFGDRIFTFTSIGPSVVGASWIQTANDSRAVTTDPTVKFSVINSATTGTVYLGVDTRIENRLSWMDSNWTLSGEELINNEATPRHFALWQNPFLLGNKVNYWVIG